MSVPYVILMVLHVASAAAFFGVPLGLASMCKRGLGDGPQAFRRTVAEANRRGQISAIAGLATFATGLVLIFQLGGFGVVGPNIHFAMSLVLAMIFTQGVVIRPTGQRLAKVAEGEMTPESEKQALEIITRLTILSGVVQLAWMAVLVLMFVRF